MKKEWLELYESMQQELANHPAARADPKTEIERCFNISQKYWSQVRALLENHVFLSAKDEIEFYKTIKPLFKSHIEYFNLLYHSELFKPLEYRSDKKEFWLKELQKLDRFILDNPEFYTYFKTGATNRDEEFFLSAGQTVYYDDLIAMLTALERYAFYVQIQLLKN